MRVIVAINDMNQQAPNFQTIPPYIQTSLKYKNEPVDIVIHNSPQISIVPKGCIVNFDILIDHCLDVDDNLKVILGSKYIPLVRNSKFNQYVKLNAAIVKLDIKSIEVPVFHYNALGVFKHTSNYNFPFRTDPDKFYVVKDDYGAKGLHQALVPSNVLSAFLTLVRNTAATELKTKFPTVKFGIPTDSEYLFLNSERLIVQEYIADIECEYRVLYADNIVSIVKRKRNDAEYIQANMAEDAIIDGVKEEIRELPTQVVFDLEKILKEIGFQVGSIDLYKRTNGTWGIFEYCHEFGHVNYDPLVIENMLSEYIINRVEEYLKN